MKVLILCGGRGTRLNGERPKPLIEIGGRPILWHVMSIYAAQGFEDFLLLTGYQGEAVADWARSAPWRVECVDTGARHADRRARARGPRPAVASRSA